MSEAWALHCEQAVVVYDAEGAILSWSAGAERLYGWTEAEARAGEPFAAWPATQRDEPFDGQDRRTRKGGHIVTIRLWRSAGPVAEFPSAAAIEFAQPAALTPEEAWPGVSPLHSGSVPRGAEVPDRFDILLEHMPVALWQVDVQSATGVFRRLRDEQVSDLPAYLAAHPALIDFCCGTVTITAVNRAAADLMGTPDDVRCLGPARYIYDASPHTALRVMDAHFRGLRNHVEEMKLRTFDGREIDVLFLATFPMPPEDMSVAFIVMIDIGDRLRAETELRRIHSEFAHMAAQTTMGEVVTSIAHELRQPLGAIVTNCEASLRWLDRAEPNLAKVHQLGGRAVEAAMRAVDIIDGIEGAATQGAMQRLPVRLQDVAQAAIGFVRESGQADHVTLSALVEGDPEPVTGDPILLRQVLVNLLTNAIQAMDGMTDMPLIAVTTTREEAAIAVTVHDNGPGFPDEHLSRVFGGFFTTKPSGYGIGLTICRSIVAAHGGTISAGNPSTGGALVRLVLPLADTPIPKHKPNLPKGLMV